MVRTVQRRSKWKGDSDRSPSSNTVTINNDPSMPNDRIRLLKWIELPAWQRNNEFIHGSYRQASYSYRGSVRSIGLLHNESMNIWSHLLGAILFIILGVFFQQTLKSLYPSASWRDGLVIGYFFVSAVLCLALSSTYHTLSDHSEATNDMSGKLDLLGIVLLISGHFVPGLYYGWYCEPTLQIIYCAMVVSFAAACAIAMVNPEMRTPKRRKIRTVLFMSFGLSALIPLIHALIVNGYSVVDRRISMVPWMLTEWIVQVMAGLIYGTRVPERWYPGSFDVWGSSHQIFHILIVIAPCLHAVALSKAFRYSHSGDHC